MLALLVLAAVLGTTAPARAQSTEELRAARELFQEAFKDEQDKHHAEALEKFQRVAKVKESASVRYRIATNLAALGRLREARDMYRALAAVKPSLPASDQETADSGAEKAAELDRRIPRLALRIQDAPPPDVRVTVDGAPVPVSTTPRSLELDPGDHVIAATGRGVAPSEQKVTLVEGAPEIARTVSFTPDPNRATEPPTNGGAASVKAAPRNNTLAWVAVGGGGLLVIVGGGLLLAREGAISDIEESCPLRICPASRRSDIESAQNRAELFGPLGIGLGIVGVAALGVGAYMLLRPGSTAPPQTATAATNTPIRVRPTSSGLAWTF